MVDTQRPRQVLRVDGPEKVSGAAIYSGDVRLPGLLVGLALRSPFPHARILRVDASAALRVPGVHAILAAADLPERLIGKGRQDIPLLARDRVRFVGEKVAVVAAESRDAAEEALKAIRVDYEELPAVFDPEAALQPDAPLIHPDRYSYRYAPGREGPPFPTLPNANSHVEMGKGDVEEGFAASAHVFEDVFRVPMQHVGFIEPHSCTVQIEPSGTVRLWSCVKQPFGVRSYFAQATGLDERDVVVMPARIGGDFGGKGYLVDEPLAYFLARATGRPVQMVMSQNEEFLAGIPRHAATIRIKSGLDGEGHLIARQVHVLFNSGAYAGYRPNPSLMGFRRAAGAYRIPHVQVMSTCVYTNQMPSGHMRAPGQPQVTFAAESHTDMLARRLGMDPLEFRRLNVVRDGDEGPLGDIWPKATALEVLERAARAIDWQAPRPRGRGRGLALSERATGAGRAEVAVEVDAQGEVLVRTGVPDVGTGAHTVLGEVVARTLGLEVDMVRVVQEATDRAPHDPGSGGSHVTNATGGAARAAAQSLGERLCSLAAEATGWREGSVELAEGRFRSPEDPAGVPFRELAARLAQMEGGRIAELADHRAVRGDASGYACHAVEVSVDEETGQVRIERMVAVHDVGAALNPTGLLGQIEGGLLQGLGMGLMEELRVEGGRAQTVNFVDYKIPCIADIPPLSIDLLENGDGPGPFGAKGIGEIPSTPSAPALANAVENAVGARITSLPITAERVFKALRRQD